MHILLSHWHWCWGISAATVASLNTNTHVSGTNGLEQTHINTQTHQYAYMWWITKWLTLAHTHSWCSRWLAVTRTRTPSVNSHRLWCYYTLSSLRRSAISPLMSMIHSVWSDNSIYTPANNGEWKSERMIAAYLGATASTHTQCGHNTHTQIQPWLSIHSPVLSICALSAANTNQSRPQSSRFWGSMRDNFSTLHYTYKQHFLFILRWIL